MVFLDEIFGAFKKSPYLCIVSNSTKLHKMRERADDCRETGVSFIKKVFLTTNIKSLWQNKSPIRMPAKSWQVTNS